MKEKEKIWSVIIKYQIPCKNWNSASLCKRKRETVVNSTQYVASPLVWKKSPLDYLVHQLPFKNILTYNFKAIHSKWWAPHPGPATALDSISAKLSEPAILRPRGRVVRQTMRCWKSLRLLGELVARQGDIQTPLAYKKRRGTWNVSRNLYFMVMNILLHSLEVT